MEANPYVGTDEVCIFCGEKVEDGPLSVCFDPLWKENVWGGDSHEVICPLHRDCFDLALLELEEQKERATR